MTRHAAIAGWPWRFGSAYDKGQKRALIVAHPPVTTISLLPFSRFQREHMHVGFAAGSSSRCISLRLTSLLFSVAAAFILTPTIASAYDACHGKVTPWNEHCYAIAYWSPGSKEPAVNGANISILTSQQAVPGGKSGEEAFVTNELWENFANGGWVEAGQISDSSTEGKGLRYFYASDVEGKALYKVEFSNGPADNTWNGYSIQYAGSGIWYYYLAGGGPWGFGGQPSSTTLIQDGLEMTQTNIENNGSSTNAKHLSGGKWWEGYEGGESGMAKYTTIGYNGDGSYTADAPTCVYQSEAWAGDAAFGSQPCPPGDDLLEQNLTSMPQSNAVPGATGAVASGPVIALSEVDAIAKLRAKEEGDIAPTSISASRTTRNAAFRAALDGYVAPSEAEVQPWLEGEVYLVEVDGDFAANDQPVPAGQSAPTGTVLGLVIDARTGEVNATAITSKAIPVANLGGASRLEN